MLSQLDQMGDSTDLYENNCNCVCHCIIKCGTSTRADLQRTSSDYYKASPHFLHCEVLNYEVLRRSYPVLGYYIPVHRGGLEHKFRPEIILHPRRSKPLHWVSHNKEQKQTKTFNLRDIFVSPTPVSYLSVNCLFCEATYMTAEEGFIKVDDEAQLEYDSFFYFGQHCQRSLLLVNSSNIHVLSLPRSDLTPKIWMDLQSVSLCCLVVVFILVYSCRCIRFCILVRSRLFPLIGVTCLCVLPWVTPRGWWWHSE